MRIDEQSEAIDRNAGFDGAGADGIDDLAGVALGRAPSTIQSIDSLMTLMSIIPPRIASAILEPFPEKCEARFRFGRTQNKDFKATEQFREIVNRFIAQAALSRT